MRITSVNQNYNQKSKNNNQSFGNFIKLKVPYSMIPNSGSISPKKSALSALTFITKIAEKLKEVSGNEVNVYRRSLKDMNFFDRNIGLVHDDMARTLFVEDNNGKNASALMKVANNLLENKFSFEVYSNDLFAPRPKAVLEVSNLYEHAKTNDANMLIKM